MKPRSNYEISNSTRRKSENGEFGVKMGLEGGGGGSKREGREQNASGNANDRLEAFPPRWPMVAALKADGAPETSSKKKDKECRNDGERDPRSW